MRFSSALATAVLSFVSLASADNLGVATVYRYINSTATVYANYCPCAATTTVTGLTAGTSAPQQSVVNNNAGSGSSPVAGSTSANTPASPNGANTGAQPNAQAPGASYVTVTVQYSTSVIYSTFATTITLGPQQTITSVVTNTMTSTIPVTITSTITSPNGGAGVDPNANAQPSVAAPFGNYTTSAMTATSTSILPANSTVPAGSGVDSGANSAPVANSTITSTSQVVLPTTAPLANVTSSIAGVNSTTTAAVSSSSTAAASSTVGTTSTTSSAPASTATVNILYDTSAAGTSEADSYYDNIYTSSSSNDAQIFADAYPNTGFPNTTSAAGFVFYLVSGMNSIYLSFANTTTSPATPAVLLGYSTNATDLAAGTPVQLVAANAIPSGVSTTGFANSGGNITLTDPTLKFYATNGGVLGVTSAASQAAVSNTGYNTADGTFDFQTSLPTQDASNPQITGTP